MSSVVRHFQSWQVRVLASLYTTTDFYYPNKNSFCIILGNSQGELNSASTVEQLLSWELPNINGYARVPVRWTTEPAWNPATNRAETGLVNAEFTLSQDTEVDFMALVADLPDFLASTQIVSFTTGNPGTITLSTVLPIALANGQEIVLGGNDDTTVPPELEFGTRYKIANLVGANCQLTTLNDVPIPFTTTGMGNGVRLSSASGGVAVGFTKDVAPVIMAAGEPRLWSLRMSSANFPGIGIYG